MKPDRSYIFINHYLETMIELIKKYQSDIKANNIKSYNLDLIRKCFSSMNEYIKEYYDY